MTVQGLSQRKMGKNMIDKMRFTYSAYRDLLALLRENGYSFRSYHDYEDAPRCVILRHDIDVSLSCAVRLAELEAEEGVHSTWFVLLRTDFYNPFSRDGLAVLRHIQSLGHEIGLHFDEAAYAPAPEPDGVIQNIVKERRLLSELLETEVSSVSMHRPSRATLDADYQIPGVVNSYGRTFFHDFKYLSDSSRHWREPVLDIIRSGEYDRLHILTHAFWYHEEEENISETVGHFVRSANRERYFQVAENVPFVFAGNAADNVEGFSSLTRYKPGSFTWVSKRANIPEGFDLSQITLAIVSEEVDGDFRNVIQTPESKRAFFSSMEHFYGEEEEERPAVGQFTYISPRVKLGKNVRIGHNCTLDGDITIGDGTVIWNGVTIINRVVIGRNCDIHSGAVIGHDGYAYTEGADHRKSMVKHFGGVSIGDEVLIGENVCISRGTIDDTVLESGVKIDSLSHIAHNCHWRRNAAAAAPCRTNGSVIVGENAYLAGAVVRNQCSIGENAFVGLGAVVVKNVPPCETVVGNPAKPLVRKNKIRN